VCGNRYYWWLAVVCIFAAGILVQANMILNFDVSWLMTVANKLLLGGHYYTDFVETNPPLILYLYTPAVILARITHLSFSIAFKIYAFTLAVGSLYICNILLRKIFDDSYNSIRYALLVVIAFAWVLMPGYSFGEREHFAIMLTLPYLFLLDLRLAKKALNFYLVVLLGFMAGIGFAIKPHFLFALILCELFFMYKKRSLFAWLRLETVIIGLVILLYVVSLFLLTPNYIFKVWPLVYHLYFIAAREPFSALIAQPTFIFWLIVLGAYFLLYEKIRHKNLAEILLFASTGYLISYFIQHTTWYYHLLPALTIVTILMVLFIGEIILSIAKVNWLDIGLVVLLQLSILVFPVMAAVRHISMGILTTKHMQTNCLFQFVKNNAYQQPIYVFALQIPIIYGLVDYAKVTSASRFPSQLFMPGLIWLSNQTNLSETQKIRLKKQKKEIIDIVVFDLQKNQPKIILVNQNKQNLYPNKEHFDYIKFFSQDSRFRKFFQRYRYFGLIDHFAIYILKK
jgi:hypothetical protein